MFSFVETNSWVDINLPYDALIPIDLSADRKAYASDKQRQVNAQFLAGPAHCCIWAVPLPRSLTFLVESG